MHDGHQGPQEINVQPEFLKWLTDPAENGAGALYDFGCYGADLMTWLMHGEAPLSVTAVAQTDKPDKYPHVDDDATIILRYPHTQAVLMPSWNWTFGRKDMEVYGTKGYAIAVNPTEVQNAIQRARSGADDNRATPRAPTGHVSALSGGRPPGRAKAARGSNRAGHEHGRHADPRCGARVSSHG